MPDLLGAAQAIQLLDDHVLNQVDARSGDGDDAARLFEDALEVAGEDVAFEVEARLM